MPQPRNHNEWFQPLSLGGRKSCTNCHKKLLPNEFVWAWGQYVNAKWNKIKEFCKSCFHEEVVKPLLAHAGPCGCTITLCARSGYRLVDWIVLPEPEKCHATQALVETDSGRTARASLPGAASGPAL